MKNETNITQLTAHLQTYQDFKNAVIVVSVALNVFVLVTWMVASLSSEYAAQLATLI